MRTEGVPKRRGRAPAATATQTWIVEAIRPADNVRVMFGPFNTERAAEHWLLDAKRHQTIVGDGWELTTQVVSQPETLALLDEVPRRRSSRRAS